MDVCIPNGLPENLRWMTTAACGLKPRFGYKDIRLRKRSREAEECNLFSRINKWVVSPIADLDCFEMTLGGQAQLSPQDSGIDMNSPSRKDDGMSSSRVIPDSRSEDFERSRVQLKRRRLSVIGNSASEDKPGVRKRGAFSSRATRRYSLKSQRSSREFPSAAPKTYKLVSNFTGSGSLVIKLRACPSEFHCDSRKEVEMESRQADSTDISSTVQTTSGSCSGNFHDVTLDQGCNGHASATQQTGNLASAVSSTTRCRKKNFETKQTSPLLQQSTKSVFVSNSNAVLDSLSCGDDKSSEELVNLENALSEKFTGLDACGLTMTSVNGDGWSSRKHAKQKSKTVHSSVSMKFNGEKLPSPEITTTMVTSSCGASASDEHLHCENSDEKKADHSGLSQAQRNSDGVHNKTNLPASKPAQLRHLPGNYQVTRRHARIFRRSTLVPQLHRPIPMPPRDFNIEKNQVCDVMQKKTEARLSSSLTDIRCKSPTNVKEKVSEVSVSQLENDAFLDEILCNLPSDFLCGNDDSEAIPNLLCESLLESDQQNTETLLDKMLDQLPVTSSLTGTEEAESIPAETPTNSTREASFISDQKRLIKLRHGIFCLLKTLVPQLQTPDRFDIGGHAVDEMVDVLCDELNDSDKMRSRSKTSSDFQSPCLNSSVELCRSPHDCLGRLRRKVMTMLQLLLGIDLSEFDEENLLESLLDTVVSANCQADGKGETACDGTKHPLTSDEVTPELSAVPESSSNAVSDQWLGQAQDDVSSLDSFSDIPELLDESDRFVMGEADDFLEPPKLTAVDER